MSWIKIESLVFLMIFLKSAPLQTAVQVDHWVVWNIGQGQWVTHVLNDTCLHYDVGGEVGSFSFIRQKILKLCFSRQNEIILSHWDFDHYANIVSFAKAVPRLCWLSQPSEKVQKVTAKLVLEINLHACLDNRFLIGGLANEKWQPVTFNSSNESSGVFQDENVLLPGDSPINQEKTWLRQMNNLTNIEILVLGHHGSRTSTGDELLRRLMHLKMTIASARFAKYHHPHFLTLKRIKQRQVPVVKTEDWGNIYF